MKIFIPILLFSHLVFAQMIIGGPNGTAPANKKEAVLIEFEANQNKGIILPYITTRPVGKGLVGGTIALDATTVNQAKVVYYNGTSWIDLSHANRANITTALAIQNQDKIEGNIDGMIIGSNDSHADGALILESTNRAMVLPQVESTDDIINPSPGMMVYIKKTGSERFAVFNGAKWTYWTS